MMVSNNILCLKGFEFELSLANKYTLIVDSVCP
jgi:hypothetical protein